MKTIQQFPGVALFFGAVAVGTAAILVTDTPKIVRILFAVVWLITGVLAFYVSLFRKPAHTKVQ
jgi:disulfide bond formation protein DsbB